MEQLNIFDINKIDVFNSMLEKLDKYGIDEYYRNHHKGKNELLRTISSELEVLPNYYEYRKEMFEMLQEYFKEREDVDLIYYEEFDYIRIFEPKASYPVYCLEMINRKIV